jgi:nuclear transport factor 2 (NTF2) superfamily protein
MRGTPAIRKRSPPRTRSTPRGGTGGSSSPAGRRSRSTWDRTWARELDYRLIEGLWACNGNRIGVRFAYEWHDDSGTWFRSDGNENWEFDEDGLVRRRLAGINDLPIAETERLYRWPQGRRPDGHPGLSDLGL